MDSLDPHEVTQAGALAAHWVFLADTLLEHIRWERSQAGALRGPAGPVPGGGPADEMRVRWGRIRIAAGRAVTLFGLCAVDCARSSDTAASVRRVQDLVLDQLALERTWLLPALAGSLVVDSGLSWPLAPVPDEGTGAGHGDPGAREARLAAMLPWLLDDAPAPDAEHLLAAVGPEVTRRYRDTWQPAYREACTVRWLPAELTI
ncbi:hypothetical protein [Yinghuangia soli]|uniref:Uncharacterized protein n=1 Tax=Yinghuangia soli TaxID=2908204 RepID=A0AA41Q6G2_9ACTN|nr:hypothetical protein [Yinghuangia soli]MCF2532388.1 hypothetical protein [Yinghuangia soli]